MRSRRSGRVCHSSAIWRTIACSMTSPSTVSVAPVSRSRISSAIRLRWSSMLLRITSVGCAVSTGTISASSSSASTAPASMPSAVRRVSALSTSAPISSSLPCRSSARFASIENSMKPRTNDSVSSRLSASRLRASAAASPRPRCRSTDEARTYRLGALEQLLAAIRTDDVAQQLAEITDVFVLRDRRGAHVPRVHATVYLVGLCRRELCPEAADDTTGKFALLSPASPLGVTTDWSSA